MQKTVNNENGKQRDVQGKSAHKTRSSAICRYSLQLHVRREGIPDSDRERARGQRGVTVRSISRANESVAPNGENQNGWLNGR